MSSEVLVFQKDTKGPLSKQVQLRPKISMQEEATSRDTCTLIINKFLIKLIIFCLPMLLTNYLLNFFYSQMILVFFKM